MLCLLSPESAVPKDHPIRRIKALADDVLRELSPLFDQMYGAVGRPSVPPERLLKATILMALYSVRSERLFCEQLGYNLLYRWFLDMDMTEEVFDRSVFSLHRARLLEHNVAADFFHAVVARASGKRLISNEHFTVDGTLIEAWASLKSFKKKDKRDDDEPPPAGGGKNPEVDFHGEKPSDERRAACRAEHQQSPPLGDRRAHDSPRRILGQPTSAQTHRGDLRLDEDGRWFREDALQRLGQDAARSLFRGGCVQPPSHGEAAQRG